MDIDIEPAVANSHDAGNAGAHSRQSLASLAYFSVEPLPAAHIKIEPHPHDKFQQARIINLDTGLVSDLFGRPHLGASASPSTPQVAPTFISSRPKAMPWLPFCSRPDFAFANAHFNKFNRDELTKTIQDLRGAWDPDGTGYSPLTFKDGKDMEKFLDRATRYVVPVWLCLASLLPAS